MDIHTIESTISNNHPEDDNFSFDALNYLITDENEILSIIKNNSQEIDEIILVPFKINLTFSNPFNLFVLQNNVSTGKLIFPFLNLSIFDFDVLYEYSIFLNMVKCYLYSIMLTNNFENFDSNIDFKGLYLHNEKIYLFIDLTRVDIQRDLIYKDASYWLVLVDEIVNKKRVCNIEIDKKVTDFFLNNSDFLYFKNSKKEQIEIPSVVYSGTQEKLLYFTYMFGKTKDYANSLLGTSYYFTNYENAIRQGGWSKNYTREYKYGKEITENETGKYIKGGIIRYALFLGECLLKENMENDDIDMSEVKNMKMEKDNNECDYEYEKMTLRISDYDATWKNNYDSVFLGKIELDNGKLLLDTPMYVIKDFNNQTPLSYHIINKKSLTDKFYYNGNYQIL